METYNKDIVKKLLERQKEKILSDKDKEISLLKTELEAIKLEKELAKEYNIASKEETNTDEIDKILGGLND